MILNLDELIALTHPPSANIQSRKLERQARKTKPAPPTTQTGDILLGINAHDGEQQEVRLAVPERLRHAHIVGASGTGKSSLLLNLIVQDIQRGAGIGLIDPHGDLVDAVATHIPPERFEDVILFDPSDQDFAIGFNILRAHNELEKNVLASDLVAVFQRLSTTWGDQMSSVLGNAILAFLESDRGGTLIDLRRFLLEPGFRNEFLKSVSDSEIIYYWQHHFPLLKGAPVVSVLTRLDSFLRTKTIRYMVAQKDDCLDFPAILNEGKIFLAKLSQGLIGEENSYLLGSLLVSKFQQTAMSRQAIARTERNPYLLYLDEFHHFATPSMVSILTGARKYALGLTLAHQELRQLETTVHDLASAVLTNPYARVCFRLGDQDARKLESGFSNFDSNDLQNLSIGQAICRVERADFDFNVDIPRLDEVDEQIAQETTSRITALSRKKYSTPREIIDRVLQASRASVGLSEQKPVVVEPPKVAMPLAEEPLAPPIPSVIAERGIPEPKQQPSLAGKGGREHKYLQQLIRQWGQGMGYLATVEKTVLNGAGLIDVALEKAGRTLACEITVTTPIEKEIQNVRKCVEAGFELIAVVASDSKKLQKVETAIRGALLPPDLERVKFFTPDALFAFIEALEALDASKEVTVRGYKVKVNYRTVDQATKVDRNAVISKVLAGSLKRTEK